MRTLLLTLTLLLGLHSAAQATWSIIAVDRATGRVAIASATCVPQAAFANFPARGLMDVQAIVIPGRGIAAAQAGVDRTRANQTLIYQQMRAGVAPAEILEQLRADSALERRQFAMVDLEGRAAAFSGAQNGAVSLHMTDRVPGTQIVFAVQGNILASDEVVYQAARAFREGEGDMLERVMRAMEAADREGGDRRCTCASEPRTAATAACTLKTAHVAYLLVADADDVAGQGPNDGEYELFLDVTDQNILPHESPNPVTTLRMRFEEWRRGRG